MRILIVEDEVKIRAGLSRLINQQTHHEIVGEGKNGEEGISLALRYKPDLIITDIRMPKIDGLEMLKVLQKDKLVSKTVILTGYSEFDYAKQAIGLGVKDYLIKPIGLDDIENILEKIEKEIEAENKVLQGSAESLMRDILLGGEEEEVSSYDKLEKIIGIQANFSLYVGYIGSATPSYKKDFKRGLRGLNERYEKYQAYTIFIETLQQMVCLVISEGSIDSWEEDFCRYMIEPYRGQKWQPAWGRIYFTRIDELKSRFNQLQEMLQYSLSLGNDRLLNKQIIENKKFSKVSYPIQIENKFKIAICKNEKEIIPKIKVEFLGYIQKSEQKPEDIRNDYLKLITSIMKIVEEIDMKLYGQIQSMQVVKRIGDAYTKSELEQLFEDVLHKIEDVPEKRGDIRNYTILRVINYIRNHYNEGITLEEVARQMDLTPEYLSTLFNKEMDINFSNFLKQFRMSHAKRLLKGTDMKIYEVAEAVGYSDAKYFMRVFKEVQGMSPKEFRQM